MRMPGVESEYLTGVLTNRISPQAGCCIVWTMFRATTVDEALAWLVRWP